ncbi:hypothetical protein [Microbacterium sp. SD291]|nr:hypothetical protein [Microbacterium sp. SD291]
MRIVIVGGVAGGMTTQRALLGHRAGEVLAMPEDERAAEGRAT